MTYSESPKVPTAGCANAYSFIRTWVAEDGCGNKTTITQKVNVVDNEAPKFVLTPAADTTVDCNKVPAPADVKYTVTDNCTTVGNIKVTYSESPKVPTAGCANAYSFIRTWVAEDGCGNKTTITQKVNVVDNEAPKFVLTPAADTTVDCDKVPAPADVKYTVTDNCTPVANIKVTYTESPKVPTAGCANAYTFTRTWLAEDGCGNKTSISQNVTVVDRTAPVFGLKPATDTTVDCDKVPVPADVKYTVTDNCTPVANIKITYTESPKVPTAGCANAYTFTRTWLAEDGCGNKTSISQNVTVVDRTAPVFGLKPATDTTVNCDKVPTQADVKFTVTDNCTPVGNIKVTYSESPKVPTAGCANAYSFIRTWLAEDGCGNKTSITQKVTVVDNEAPKFGLKPAADTTVDCDKVPAPADVKYTVTDNCTPVANIKVTYTESPKVPTAGCANAYTFTRTWLAEDGCGNKTSITQNVTVVDRTAPVFGLKPAADTTVDCDKVPAPADVKYTVTDNCTPVGNIKVTYSESAKVPTAGCANAYTFTRTWLAEDGCGNKTSITQNVTVVDRTAPVFGLKPVADTTVDCDKVPAPADVKYTVTDNCTPVANIKITYTESPKVPTAGCANAYTFTRTWLAEDGCGNKTSISQNVTVVDRTAPVFGLKPATDTTVNCDKVPTQADVKFTVTDNCTPVGNIKVTYSESPKVPTAGCANAYSFTRTWLAEDGCGNKTAITQKVTVVDNEAPKFGLKPAADTTVDCDKVPAPADVKYTVTDNCTPVANIKVTYTESPKVPTAGCANAYTFTRTWLAEDGCGNKSTITQNVTVVDRTAPVFGLKPAADTTVDCDKVPAPADVKYTVTDNCTPVGNIKVTYTESPKAPTAGCANAYTFTRTWLAEDGCGNKTSISQNVTVVDRTAPVFGLKPAADTTVDCDKVPAPADVKYTVTDNCTPVANIKITYTESPKVPTAGCANAYTFTRTWLAEDGCGNKTSITQNVTVVDRTAPVFGLTPAADTTVNCDKVPTQADVKFTVTDNCTPVGNIKVTYSESPKVPTAGCANAYSFTRTWLAEDGCGNKTSISQKVNVVDNEAPKFGLKPAADTTVDCDKVPAPADVKYTVTDNCTTVGNIKVTYTESPKAPTAGCANAYTFTRTWVAEDGCGNKSTITQNVTVVDRTAPVFGLKPAADTTVDCDKVPAPADVKFTVTDNCTPVANIKVTYTESPKAPTAGCANAYTFTRTWLAEDGCGNKSTITQNVTVVDRTAPVFGLKPAADTTVDCDKVPAPADVKFTVTDNCTPVGNIKVTYSESPKVPAAGCANAYSFIRTWTAEDGCGNKTAISQKVTVVDDEAPKFGLKPAADTTVDCDKVPAPGDVKYTVTDNCTPVANIKVTYTESPKVPTAGCANAYTFTRTWVAEDGCGNKTAISQNVTVVDRTAPVFGLTPAADTTVNCDKVPTQADVKFTVTDNCTPVGNIKVTYSESPKVPTAGCANAYSFTRTWLAEDGCGNKTSISQKVNVVDNEAPKFGLKPAADTTVDCDKVPAPADVKYTVTDNCTTVGNIKVTYTESPKAPTAGCANAYTFTRTWVAEDGCGNKSTITQNVTVVDRTAPVFGLKPAADTTVNCDKVPAPADVKFTVTDNCTPVGNIKVTYSESPKVPTAGCANAYSFIRTWMAEDGCGNKTTLTQKVNVVDNEAPKFGLIPAADTTVDCDKVPAPGDVKYTVTDNCTPVANIKVTYTESPKVPTAGCANAYTFTRTWLAEDGCGNKTAISQNVTVVDRTAPVFGLKPAADTTVDCDKVPAPADVKYTVTDNCTPVANIKVTYTESPKVPTAGCANAYTFTRTWLAEDGCGNKIAISQNVTVVDKTAPVFGLKPAADTTVNCDKVPTQADVKFTVTDNCTPVGNIKVTYSESPKVPTAGCANAYSFTRTWVAADGCGNTATITQKVTVVDNEAPKFGLKPAADTTVDCDKVPAPADVKYTVTDNCTPVANIKVTYTESPKAPTAGCANAYTFTRTWVAEDGCGNKSTITQNVTVVDRTAPVFGLKPAADTTVDCDKVPAPADVKYTVTDNCTPVGNIKVTYSESPKVPTAGCANAYSFIRTWIAEDGCGNKTSISQKVTVVDDEAPKFGLKPAADTTVDCDKVPAPGDVKYTVTDNCTPVANIKVTYTESPKVPTAGCANAYTFTRTWLAEDGCGNKTSISQNVTVVDKTAPVFGLKPAADTTVNCDKVPTQADVKFTVTDNCTPVGNIKVTYSESAKVPTAGCANAYTFTRTWVAADGCGNTATITQKVTVVDNEAPKFGLKPAADTTVDCDKVPAPADVKYTVTDNCTTVGNIKVTYTESPKAPTAGCANAYTFTRTWVAEDGCGNKSTITQNVTVVDRTAPVFGLKPAADTTVDCDKVPAPADVKYTVTDNCTPVGNIKVTYTESPKAPTAGCANAYTFTRTWVAEDGCGNKTSISQKVTVVDRTAPVFGLKPAADTTVNCDKVPAPADVKYTVTDNCTPVANIKVTYSESPKVPTAGCANAYSFIRTWVAEDGCGNKTSISQKVTVVDNEAPKFGLKPAADTTVDCDKVPAPGDVKYTVTDNCTPVANIKVTYTESPKVPTAGCANAYTFTRTWLAEDGCGNKTSISQNVTVVDKTAPVFGLKPAADTTVNCDKVPTQADVKFTVTDNCTPVGNIKVTYSESPKVPTAGCANAYSFIRTWIAADGCGNTATITQKVTVVDNEAPKFGLKPAADTTVDCDKVPAPADVKYTVTDNCTPVANIKVTYTESPKAPTAGCANAYTFTRTWVAEDGCGNKSTITQNVTVVDRTAPVFGLKPAADTTVDCDKVPAPADVKYTVTDNCTPVGNIKVTYTESPKAPTAGCANAYTFTRTWVAEDGCGNKTSISQKVTVVDRTAPVFGLKPAADTTVDCDKVPAPADVKYTVTDNCTPVGNIKVTYTESPKAPTAGCANAYTFTRTWVAEDGCGNKTSISQNVTVVDRTAPVFGLKPAADTTVDCDKVPAPADVKYTVTDNCTPVGNIKVTYTESPKAPTAGCANAYTFTRTWVAEDGCGNKTSISQKVTVVDRTAPVFTLKPATDTIVDCDKVPTPTDVKYTVTDNCTPVANIKVTYTESPKVPTAGCANAYTFTRTWVAADGCGNTATITQKVTVVDNEAPKFVLKPAADTTVDCDKVPLAGDLKYAVTDNCTPVGNIKVTYSESPKVNTPGCANAYTFTRTWVAADGCGNTATIKQVVNVIDRTAPVFGVKPAADTTVDCDKVPTKDDVKFTVTDNCTPVGSIKVTYTESPKVPTAGCDNAYTFTRTWVAEDGCGNATTIQQNVTVVDRTAPVFTLKPAADTTVDCDKVPAKEDIKLVVTDNCTPTSDIRVVYSETPKLPAAGCANAYSFTRTWLAVDGCGNKTSITQNVTVVDRTAPVFGLKPAADTTVDCDKVPAPADVKFTVTDNCTPVANIKVTYTESPKVPTAGCANAYTFTRTWLAEDGCGNKTSISQKVTVIDNKAPEFGLKPAADTTVDCDKVPAPADVKYTVTDNCTPVANIRVTYTESPKVPTPGCPNGYTFTRTWVAADGCGNTATISQKVTVQDKTAPVFTWKPAADTTVDCDKVPAPANVKFSVTDNCTPVTKIQVKITDSPKIPTVGCANAYTFTRTWTATDACGNTAETSQKVTVIDNIAPVFTYKPVADTVVDCDKVPDPADVKYIVTDNCTPVGDIKVTYSETPKVPAPGCNNTYNFTRIWVAADGCGNTTTIKQNVSVVDRTPPTFLLKPAADTTVDCDRVPAKEDVIVIVTDNCLPANIKIDYSETPKVPTPGCANAYTFTRIWVVSDGCGNSATTKQKVNVVDRTAPVFTLKPAADTTVDCDKVPTPADVKYAVTDNCTPVTNIKVTYSESPKVPTAGCTNAYTFVRTWIATDGCGNATTVKQNVTVVDRTAPVFTMTPAADTTVDCDKVPTPSQVRFLVTDNCTPVANIKVAYSESPKVNTPGCANAYTFTRTWIATDGCGNATTITQVVNVIDRTAPVFNLKPAADTTVDCDKVPTEADVKFSVSDNCTPAGQIKVTYSESPKINTPGCANAYTFIRTWVAEDGCGNSATIKQNVTVIDRTAPVFHLKPAADTTVDCDKVPAKDDVKYTVSDNCTPAAQITVTYSETPKVPTPGCTNAYVFTRTWVASDGCGNTTTIKQNVTVVDRTAPVFTLKPAADTTVDCDKVPAPADVKYTVTDNCTPVADIKVTYSESPKVPTPGCANAYTFIRTWIAEDGCGNKTSISQNVTVVDRTAPVFTLKPVADTTVDCDKVPAPADVKYTVTDNCTPAGNIKVAYSESAKVPTPGCANGYTFTRTWVATDGCGNATTISQRVTVQDTTKPVFTVKPVADTTVDCDKVANLDKLPVVATDNCSPAANVKITYTDAPRVTQPGCVNSYTFIRTWTATDDCNNRATFEQHITVQDTTKPVFSAVAPKDTLVNCDQVPAWPVITATDNCSANIQVVTGTRKVTVPGACAGNYKEIRTWTATDECGNKAFMQQTITVQDTTKPVFVVAPPADTTVSCDDIPAPANNVKVTDNCSTTGNGLTLTRSIRTEKIPGACVNNYRIIRTWEAKDACGNTTIMTQVVTVKDTTRPVISPAPADVIIYCQDEIPAPPVLTATDNCDYSFPKKAIYSEDPYVKDICKGYTIVRRWTIMDACGNKANDVIQQVIVKPCDKPQLTATLPSNCSDNPMITLQTTGNVSKPTYTLVSVTPANAVKGLPYTQTSNVFNLNGATSASFIVTDGQTGCSSDTMTYHLTYIQKPVVKLGNDTTICGGNSLVLDAGAANFAYQIKWSTGATTQRINVATAGTYWVSVSNGQCVTTDTIEVSLVPTPLVDIPDTTICRGQSVKLDAYVNGAQYLWSTGSTSSSILVSTQEEFWVKVMKSGCITIDTVKVRVNPPPDISLTRDTTICPDQSIMLTVTSNGGRIQWQTGETTNSIVVNQPGAYWVSVSRDNCVVKETVNVRAKPTLNLDLGPDRNICPGGSVVLDGTNPDAISYLWNDGDPNPVKTVTQAGKYKLAVMDRFCQRIYTDSVNVNMTGLPKVNLGRDTTLCKGETLTLRAEGGNITGVRWDNGSAGPSLTVSNGGTYTVTVFNDCGSATDDITVDVVYCEPKPELPNAFSPNGDGRNDVFRPVVRGAMFDYELRVFNRWGELIFMTSDDHKGWDGKYKGVPVDVGTYVWWLTYRKVAGGATNVLKGEVTVVR
ncbi:gliding motility-associated C-terminal domain-containing protein [Chitinophaga nivalis]|uniref:gliding motility-associated C-terminal domain-containing protein n=1 Tax=Chitinophaga nivalis TaxID=2991709 RepID=UPI00222823C8|nr:gliding motility-associated C-terminal domain-containing protein [Chitinophaga nivalis]